MTRSRRRRILSLRFACRIKSMKILVRWLIALIAWAFTISFGGIIALTAASALDSYNKGWFDHAWVGIPLVLLQSIICVGTAIAGFGFARGSIPLPWDD